MFEKLKKFLGLNKVSSNTKLKQESFKCENCGGTTERLDAEKIRCKYCARVYEKPFQIQKRKSFEKSLFPDFEYKPARIEVNDQFVAFANDAEHMLKKNKELDDN